METDITVDYFREFFEVDCGDLIWRRNQGRARKGQSAGFSDRLGYRCVRLERKVYMVHRIIFAMEKGAFPKGQIDHINGIKSDNRIENLRDVSASQNQRSFSTPRKNTTSKFRGVCKRKSNSRFVATLKVKGKKIHIGYFDNENEAAIAWNKKALELGWSKEALNVV